VPEFEFITQLKGEPVALAVLAGLIFLKIIETLAKYIPFLFKKKKKPVEELLAEEAGERKEWQALVCEKFSAIESKIESLFAIIADHEELFGPLSQGTLENMLFNDNTPIFRRLKAFLRLLALNVNGRIKQKGFALILANKEIWLDVLETMPKLKLKIINKEHFEAVLNEINTNLYSGMMR